MAIQKILTYPEQQLRLKSARVTLAEDGALIKQVARDLLDTLDDCGAPGLAAVQIGVPIRMIALSKKIFVANGLPDAILINPVLLEAGDGFRKALESCPSFPGFEAVISRRRFCKVAYTNLEGKHHVLRASVLIGRALLSVCLQRTLDSLDGKLVSDRMKDEDRKAAFETFYRLRKKAA